MIRLDGQPVVTAAEMRAAEERAVAGGLSVFELMARAGEAVAAAVRRIRPGADVLVLCGPGNNRGDGYVAAIALAAAGHPVRVAALGEPRSAAAREARAGWTGAVEPLTDAAPASVVVDALFGTGLSRPPDAEAAAALRRLVEQADWSLAVDVPSGVDADTGAVFGDVPRFNLVLALGAAKPAHLLEPAAALARAVRIADIGVSLPGDVRVLARTDARGTDRGGAQIHSRHGRGDRGRDARSGRARRARRRARRRGVRPAPRQRDRSPAPCDRPPSL